MLRLGAGGAYVAKKLSLLCLAEGTQVITAGNPDGSWKTRSIETIVVGDYVLSRPDDDPSAPLERRRVTAVFRHTEYSVRVVEFENPATGDVETIRCTAGHPFWVENRGWVAAGELVAGQRVLNGDGTWSVVRSVGEEAHPEGLTVYNLEVEGGHTYFVEDGQGGQTPIWVHNHCSRTLARNLARAGRPLLAGEAAHHIVAGGSRNAFAKAARKILRQYNIRIDRAVNGVGLPRNLALAAGSKTVHSTVHTNKYYRNVLRELNKAVAKGPPNSARKRVIAALEKIRKELENGTFVY